MSVKTKEDKKRDILEYIQKRSANEDEYLTLERSEIIERFSDDLHSEEKIDELIDELVDDELIESSEIDLELVYTKSEKESIEENFSISEGPSLFLIFAVGIYMYLVFLELSDGINSYLAGSTDGEILIASVFAIAISYTAGIVSFKLGNYIGDKSTIVKEHKHFIGAEIALLAVGGLGVWFYSLERTVPPVVITYIPASVAAAVAYAKYMNGRESK